MVKTKADLAGLLGVEAGRRADQLAHQLAKVAARGHRRVAGRRVAAMTAESQRTSSARQPRRRRPYRRPDPDRIQASTPGPKGPVLKYQTPHRPEPAIVDRLVDLWRASGWTG